MSVPGIFAYHRDFLCSREPMRRPFILLLAGTLLSGSGTMSSQIGDRLDRPDLKQELPIPRERIPPAPVLSPEEALRSFVVEPGFRVELVAAEPLVEDPVAIDFGPDGRIWVVEMRGYMHDVDGRGEDLPNGRVVVLEDTDGDGRMDTSTVFLDGIVMPRSISGSGATRMETDALMSARSSQTTTASRSSPSAPKSPTPSARRAS
jgi:glucose/arabinose dehydrogenase